MLSVKFEQVNVWHCNSVDDGDDEEGGLFPGGLTNEKMLSFFLTWTIVKGSDQPKPLRSLEVEFKSA